jgi:RNA polymerase sigma-70 factor (ECF subfamily)
MLHLVGSPESGGEMTDVLVRDLERIYNEFLPDVYGFARSRLPEADAEDVTAEVFRAAAERLRADPHTELGRAWLLTAARNRIIDLWRHRARWEGRLEILRRDVEPSGAHEMSDDSEWALEALDRLAPEYRAVLILRYVEGLRSREIAEALGRNARAVDSLIARARRALAIAYDELVA